MGTGKGFFADQHFVADLGTETDYRPQYVDSLDGVVVAVQAAAVPIDRKDCDARNQK